jgi:N-acetylglucosamine-6-phosphate deacetylase
MATIGTDLDSFSLNGRTVYRRCGRLELADGTLAGADIDMISSVRFMHRTVGLPLEEALKMASLYPAQAVGQQAEHGHLRIGAKASAVHLSSGLEILSVWIDGRRAFAFGA